MNYYSLGDVSGILDVPAYTIVYLLSTRQMPERLRQEYNSVYGE